MADVSSTTCRQEASGPGWQEHFVDVKRASNTASVGLAVSQSLSFVTISHFASMEERQTLIDSAADLKRQQQETEDAAWSGCADNDSTDVSHNNHNSSSNHILFASSTNKNCDRYSVKTLLNEGAQVASSALLNRLLDFLDGGSGQNDSNKNPNDNPHFISQGGGEKMLVLAQEVFGSNSDLRHMDVRWYAEPDETGTLHPEPKVNVYTEGGHFAQHEDGMQLTLLVVLTDEYEGGGTAFYRDLDLSHDDLGDTAENMTNASHSLEPEAVTKPPAGTAMIWGGTLQHMALPVTKGARAVYVGSFDLI